MLAGDFFSLLCYSFSFYFETESYYVAQVGLENYINPSASRSSISEGEAMSSVVSTKGSQETLDVYRVTAGTVCHRCSSGGDRMAVF